MQQQNFNGKLKTASSAMRIMKMKKNERGRKEKYTFIFDNSCGLATSVMT